MQQRVDVNSMDQSVSLAYISIHGLREETQTLDFTR